MKKCSLAMLLVSMVIAVQAQDQSNAGRTRMKALSYFVGTWKGEGIVQRREGGPLKVLQEEKIEWKVDTLVLVIEGIGKDPATLKKLFHAFACVSFNTQSQEFNMKSFIMDGRQTDAYFKVVADNQFEWGFDLPNKAKIKYTINLSRQNKTWKEKGEYSPDGTTWYPTIELNLTKQN